jgi:RND family efflux transporter MFP subunit
VRAGQVIGRIDATDAQSRLRQAEQQTASAKAQVDMAQRTFDNNSALVAQGFISKSSLDTSSSSLEAAQANHRAAQAAVDLASKALQDTVLRAPITGQVAQRLAQNGERLAVDGRVVDIVDLSRIELEASLSPADSLRLRLGQSAEVRVEGASQPLLAKVVRINPSATAGSRAVLAYLELPPTEGLRQGLFAQGTLVTGDTESPVLPLDTVRTDKPQPYVQLVRDGKVVHQGVTPGARGQAAGQTLVEVPGLATGTIALAGATGALREGTPVRLPAATTAKP